jgi:hypothetical protein
MNIHLKAALRFNQAIGSWLIAIPEHFLKKHGIEHNWPWIIWNDQVDDQQPLGPSRYWAKHVQTNGELAG